jgi:hypothetical protein
MPSRQPSPRPLWRQHAIWISALALLAIAALGAPLFSAETLLSDRTTDLAAQFLYARAFGFGEMARGNLPLWNPYIYGGMPFLGDFQSALLYPPNLIFLFLPLAVALNWSFALHVFLFGTTMYVWAVWRGIRPAAAFLSGASVMFGGTFFLHIYSGHLVHVCAMAWTPLIFLGIDAWIGRRHAGWLLLAAAAAALQIYAGHPQYVYYTALIAGLYSLVSLPGAHRPGTAAAGLSAIYPLAALLGAAQLLPGLAASSEAVRSGGVAYEFAAMFSFPPENIITLFAPWALGDMRSVPYWGRCYLWEMSVFTGVGILMLAVFGLGRKQDTGRWRLVAMLVVIFLLALGSHTPIHRLLYDALPGFSSFRGASKFTFLAAPFLALLAGFGLDRLRQGEKFPAAMAVGFSLFGVVLLAGSFFVSDGLIRQVLSAVAASRESYLPPDLFEQGGMMNKASALSAFSLRWAGALFLIYSALLFASNRWRQAVWVAAFAAVAELLIFARASLSTFPLADFTFQPIANFLKEHPGDYRTLNLLNPDSAMLLRSENIWGYDPGVLKRYARLLHLSQGHDPDEASQYLAIQRPHPILTMLRCRFAFVPKPDGQVEVVTMADPFPRFALYSKYRVLPDANSVLEELKSPGFDLRQEILLETEPHPKPESGTPRQEIRVVDFSTDHWTLEIQSDRAALLVMTDSYSQDWRASALPGSVQSNYAIQPANYALRAVPLAAGRHLLRLEYVPRGFREGVVLSLLSTLGLTAALYWRPLRRRLDFGTK